MYVKGEWLVICDMCGRRRYQSECRMNYNNLIVCSDTCWEPRHPQEAVTGKGEDTSVPNARPDVTPSIGTTTLGAGASTGDKTITVASISNISQYDGIGIQLNSGATFTTFARIAPAGTTVYLNDEIIGTADSGNTVYLPNVNNEQSTAYGDVTAEDL